MKNNNKTVSDNRLKKEGIVADLTTRVEKAKAMVFTNYQGLTHQQLENLKKTLRSLEAEFVVTKNTLLKIALKDKIGENEKSHFEQPTGTLFIYNDIVSPLKELAKMVKDLKMPSIKFALLEGKPLAEKDVLKLSTLPPLPVLRAQLLGQMQSPISGLHRALNWNITKLVLTLKAIETNKASS